MNVKRAGLSGLCVAVRSARKFVTRVTSAGKGSILIFSL